MQIRTPAVAGVFYPEEKIKLSKLIEECFFHPFGPEKNQIKVNKKVFGVICPHAGYVYSGPTACHSYKAISSQNPELAVIIGPNHFGVGKDAATMIDAQWQTPLGKVQIDSESAKQIAAISEFIEIDEYSHSQDHSLEVQIPMLQEIVSNEFQILPIILRVQDMKTAMDVGNAVYEIAKGKNAIIIASSDFTHYEENSFAYQQDRALIDPILSMDVERFYEILYEKRVTACGFGAIASAMIACKKMGATKGELLSYTTSGDISGDTESVVGYGAIKFV